MGRGPFAADSRYHRRMTSIVPLAKGMGLARIFAPHRVVLVLLISGLAGLIVGTTFRTTPAWVIAVREMLVGLGCLAAFGIFEQWPARLPPWLARWALQVLGVAFVIPCGVLALYIYYTPPGGAPFYTEELRMTGFMMMTLIGLLVAPWAAVAALFKQKEFAARSQALAFELEKSQLERRALDARLRLIESQIEPHFLFNTLANVRELVEEGSPQASAVLNSLIAYLRASVPRLHDPATTMGHELQLVKAYLELMQMRMPDRLSFAIGADDAAQAVRCPPTTLLTLVENAIRHGIDPGEDGGRIEVSVRLRNGRCIAEVCDTGVGLADTSKGLGTGLSTLRERLQLAFGGDAELRIASVVPHGVRAEVEIPA
jgi:signal transduction histidine kinase